MDILQDRRALHRIPELDRQLPKTAAYLTQSLGKLRCQLSFPIAGAVCAWFDFGRDSAIAFRSDADALPISENTGLAFASEHPGRMHACGHDGHMAILLELARRLDKKTALPHNVLLIFQPAEETTGGARDLCDTGLLDKYNVQAVFGLHLWPGLEKGILASREGELMSRSCEITVDIRGRSAHIARAAEGLDALAAAVMLYQQAAQLEASLPDAVPRLLKFGKLEAGTVRNALAASAHLEGSLRAFRDEDFYTLRDGLLAIGKAVQEQTGCAVDICISDGCPAVINPSGLYRRVEACVNIARLPEPYMTAEDFSCYQQCRPAMFFFLGLGDTPALHADNFDFDEQILLKGADFFEDLAEAFV